LSPTTSSGSPEAERSAEPDRTQQTPGYVADVGNAGVSPGAAESASPSQPARRALRVTRAPDTTASSRTREKLDESPGLRLAIGDITRIGLAESVLQLRPGLLLVQLTPDGMDVPSASYNLQRLYLAYSAAVREQDSVALELRQGGKVYGWFTREGLRTATSGREQD
jgi:hypothetical protein